MIIGCTLTWPDARPGFVSVEESVAEFGEGVQVVDSADGPPRVDALPIV
jgi:hypothetical protein